MYAINLDFDPTTVGFDPLEIKKNDDGTYNVTRRFIHVIRRNNIDYNYYSLEAYCPCLTDDAVILCYQFNDSKGRLTYGVSYSTNDGEKYEKETRNYSKSIVDYWYPIGKGMVNRKYDTHINDPEQEKSVSFCISMVNDHPNNISKSRIQEYFEEYHIVFGKCPPTSPEEDPFLPDEFKKLIGIDL